MCLLVLFFTSICSALDEEYYNTFVAYIHLRASLDEGNLTEEKVSALKHLNDMQRKLLSDQEIAVSNLIEMVSVSPRRYQQEAALRFLREHEIGIHETLEVCRETIRSADLNDGTPAMVAASIEYLGDFGEVEDVELLRRLENHRHPSVLSLSRSVIGKIEQRENLADSTLEVDGHLSTSEIEVETPLMVPAQSRTPSSSGKGSAVANPLKWLILVGAIALAGILIILLRASKGKA